MPSKSPSPKRKPHKGKGQSRHSSQKQQGIMKHYKDTTPMISHTKESSSIRQMWIPKDLNLNNARPLVFIQAKSLKSMQWRSYVVSKNLLESQGYYQGNSKLWLPKQTPHSLSNPKPSHSLQDYPSNPIRKWKPDTSTLLKGPYYPYGRPKFGYLRG